MFSKAYGCAFLFFICVSSAAAQVQLPIDRELSQERQERLLQEQQRRLQELQALPERELSAPSVTADDSADCLQVDNIELQGAHSLSVRQRAQLLGPFLGQCLTSSDLNRLLACFRVRT